MIPHVDGVYSKLAGCKNNNKKKLYPPVYQGLKNIIVHERKDKEQQLYKRKH